MYIKTTICFAVFYFMICSSCLVLGKEMTTGTLELPKEETKRDKNEKESVLKEINPLLVLISTSLAIITGILGIKLYLLQIKQSKRKKELSIKGLYTNKDLKKAFAKALSIKHPSQKIVQTFIENQAIAPSQDLLNDYKITNPNNRPVVDRIISITRPLDIDFAAHCLELQQEYGSERMRVFLYFGKPTNSVAQTFPNFTAINGGRNLTIISLPIRLDPYNDNDQGEMTDLHTASSGLIIEDESFSQIVLDYLSRMMDRMQDKNPYKELLYSKKTFWLNDKRSYLVAISKAISREICYSPRIPNENIVYTGIVGSVVDTSSKQNPGDLDLVIILHEIDKKVHSEIMTIAKGVCRRFSSDNPIFKAVDSSIPVHTYNSEINSSVYPYPIQILINDMKTITEWSPFIAWHRRNTAFDIEGKFPDSIGGDYLLRDILQETHGINSCIEALRHKSIPGQRWKETASSKMELQRIYCKIDSDILLSKFIAYSFKWSVINIYNAHDSPFQGQPELNLRKCWDSLSPHIIMTDDMQCITDILRDGIFTIQGKINNVEQGITLLEALKSFCEKSISYNE